ncbi:MAG: hypothetical protein ABI779_13840 [Acidobacteriota bacterium]
MSYEPFLIDYGPGGMVPSIGGDPALVNELENLGTGMDTDGEWALGGPVVWRRPNSGRRIVGWIRGVPSSELGRAGAWRAWGVQAGPDDDIQHWPWAWELLRSEPSSTTLRELAAALATPKVKSTLPPFGSDFAGLLSEAHRVRASESGQTFSIPLESKSELAALAWFWLLGPDDPQQATLGPPRREAAAVSPRLTYAGQLGTTRPWGLRPSPFFQDAVLPLVHERKDLQAVRQVQLLREAPPQRRVLLLERGMDEVSRKTRATRNVFEEQDRTMNTDERLHANGDEERASRSRTDGSAGAFDLRQFLNPAFLVMIFLELVAIVMLLGLYRPWVGMTGTNSIGPTAVGTQTPADTSGTMIVPLVTESAGVSTPAALSPQQLQARLLSALKRPRQGVMYAGTLTVLNNPKTQGVDVQRLRVAALQIYFLREGCSDSGAVDGTVGQKFFDALHCLGDHHAPLDVLTSDTALVDWLESH